MDNGQVIPGLNEPWTLAGAKVSEWMSGFIMLICCQEMFVDRGSAGKAMPLLMAIWFFTTFGLAALRKRFPDEERGVANRAAVALGIRPPGIPAPAAIQPMWSGCPLYELDEESEYAFLNLEDLFPVEVEEEEM